MPLIAIFLSGVFLLLGACANEPTEEPPDLQLDPMVIEKIAAGQLACEREVSGSASLAAADESLARHYAEFETTVAQATEFPLNLSFSTEAETLRFRFYDELTLEYHAAATAVSLQVAILPNAAVDGYDLGAKRAVFALRVQGAPEEMSVNWSHSLVVAYFRPRQAPDDIRAGADVPVFNYACNGTDSKFKYREYPGYYYEDLGYGYEYDQGGERYTLQVSPGKTVRSVTTCIGNECTTSRGKNWAEYQKQLGEQGVFQDNEFRLPIVSNRIRKAFALLEWKQHQLGR